MNSQQLSRRLATVSDLICQYGASDIRLADIGSDHAYLPCHLALNQKIQAAVAGEVVKGPYQSAQAEVQSQGLDSMIQVRLGDGLAVIQADDAINVISICGMGGSLIRSILDEGQDKLSHGPLLVLQPNIGEATLRTWLSQHDYQIVHETIVEDSQRLYEIIVAQHQPGASELSPHQSYLGPILSQIRGPLYKQKWAREEANLKAIQAQIQAAPQPDQAKLAEIAEKLSWIADSLSQCQAEE